MYHHLFICIAVRISGTILFLSDTIRCALGDFLGLLHTPLHAALLVRFVI
jgi:hypothetical protein